MLKQMPRIASISLVVGLAAWSCSQNPVETETTDIALAAAQEDAPAGINFLPVIPRLQKRSYPLSTGHMINNVNGGSVGGPQTEHNSVSIPSGALNSNQEFITVTVQGDDGQYYAVDFAPSMDFALDVEVTLYYGAVYEGNDPEADLQAWWFNTESGVYEELSAPIDIDEGNGTMTFSVDRFSRYAWSDD